MGSPMAPSYPNLFMGELEQHILQNAPGGLIPLEWNLQYGPMELTDSWNSSHTSILVILQSNLNTNTPTNQCTF